MAAVPKKKSRSCGVPAAHAASCKTSKVPGEDSVCFLCHDGGTLVMCDRRQCPKAYHPACVGRSMQFFKTKGAWLCARHFCSKCSKQPCTYCVMCPNSFCSKCLSCMKTEVYLPLSEEKGLCETCMSLAKMIELQDTIEGKTAVNFEDSETLEFLFKEYWLLLKRFHGYNLTNSALSCTGLPPLGSSDNVMRDVPSVGVDQKIRSDPQKPSCNIATATMPGLLKPSPTNESISVPKNLRVSIKRRSTSTGSILPAKKKIRVLKLLNDSSSEDGDENKPLVSMVCGGKQKIEKSICSKALPVSSEITGAPSLSVEAVLQSSVDGNYLGAKPFSVDNISSPPKASLNVIDDCSHPLLAAPNITSPPLPTPQPMIHPPPLPPAEACKSPVNYSKLFKKPHSDKVSANSPSENNRAQNLNPACNDLVSANELSELARPKPHPSLAPTSKPLPMEKPCVHPAAKTSPERSNVSCKPLLIKPHSLATPVLDKHLQQFPQETSTDKPSNIGVSPDCNGWSLKAKSVLPLNRPHGRSHAQESCKSVDATLSTCDKAEALAPITVQNVSRIYLRRSRLEELLSEERFTLLILGAFVRIRHSKHANNYRLVQIAGTSTLQAHYYQVGEKETNVVLEVLNLDKRQRIKIDHVSNNMFTGEECERLQQSVELGFINAPTMRALDEKAAALQKVKANKCLDEKFAKLARKVRSKEPGLNEEEVGGKIPLSPNHLGKFYTQTQIDGGQQIQADQVPACVESTSTKADGHIVLKEAQVAARKQADADQHSDISVEMTTVFAETGLSKMHSPEILTTLASENCTEEEAELILPKKSQKKGLEDIRSNEYLMKERCPSLMAETTIQAQGDGPDVVFVRKHMNVGLHCDVGVDLATNIDEIAEDNTHAAKLSATSAVYPGTKDVATSNFPQGIPLTESREYGIIQHPTDNQECAQEYITTIVGSNDSDKRATDVMQWFYQDMKERTFGPFSLEQLRKWSRTGVFPPDLKIWRTVAGQNSSILLVDALNVQKIKVLGMATEKCIEVESCLDPLKQKGIIFRETGSTCHTLSKGLFGDGRMPTSRTSAHVGQRLDSSINLGDWTVPIEQAELKSRTLWNSPHSTQFSIEDVSVKRCQGETFSHFEHPVSNEECEKAWNIQTQMSTDSCWKLHTSATETSVEGEIQHKSNPKDTEGKSKPAHSKAKETSAEGERGVQSSPAHTFRKEISAVEEIEGKFNPVCTEGKSILAHTEKETLTTSDDGQSSSEIGKLNLVTLWNTPQLSQFDVLKERATSVQSQCETPCEVLVVSNEPEMAMHPSVQIRGTIADTGLNFQSLAGEASSDRKREGKSVSQRQDTLTIDEGWTSPETWDFELETWASQYDALRKQEASINRCRDEILSNLIDAVSTKECTKGTTAKDSCYTFTEDTSAYGNNISCNSEQRLEKLATLHDGWGSPGDLEQETAGWGSPNSTWFNKSEQEISIEQSCHDKTSSKKLQSKDERENTRAGGRHDGQKNVNCNLSEREEGRSLPHDIHPEKDQRWTHSSQGHGRARRAENNDCSVSSRGRDTSLSEKSRCQRDSGHLKSSGSQTRKLEDHAEYGKGTERELKRSHSRESIMCQKQVRSDQRCFASERNTSPKPTGREVESAFMRSHSREPHKQDRCTRDQKQEWKVFAEDGHETEEEVRISHSREGWKSISKERRSSLENARNRTEREVRKSHARNDIRSISREQKASPERAGRRMEKEAKRSHSRKDWRSISRDRKASPEYAGNRERKRSHSRNDRRSISRERKVYPETAGEREVRRSHSGNDRRPALREHKGSPESAGKRTEKEARKSSHSRNDWRSFSRELGASPEIARKISEKEVRSSQARNNRRSLSKEPKASSRNARKRSKEEDWKTHPASRERRTSPINPNSSSYRSLSRSGEDALRSRSFSRELRDSSACTSSSAHRSFSRNLVDGVHREASREGRRKRNNDTVEKFSGREKGSSPCQELSQRNGHVFCPKESTLQPTQTGWTPPGSPLNYPARCWSPGVAGVEKLDDPLVLSGISSKSEAPLHPGSPELLLSDSYPELPPPPPLPAPNYMRPPPPPPLPVETSHISHIDQYQRPST